jgi:anti-sigma factor ChrR (cupin superfamily)
LPIRFDLAASLAEPERLGWKPLREGIDMVILHQSPGGSTAALLRYQPGAEVPRHEHTGHEHILVLEGSQEDDLGHYPAGSFVVNPPGSRHRVWSLEGCLVLIVWERPVDFDVDLDIETDPRGLRVSEPPGLDRKGGVS